MKSSIASLDRPTTAGAGRPVPPVSAFEFWPDWLFYTPIVLYWIALGLRHGDFTLPTAANPRIEAGGLCGESKTAILDQLAPEARHWVAPYTTLRTGADWHADVPAAEAAMAAAGLAYPIVAKPDIGCNGTGVRLIENAAALARYLRDFPRGVVLVLQAFVADSGEAGLFYIRHPSEARGGITSVTLKSAPEVTGDGRATLRELILADPRTGRMASLFFPRLAARLEEVPAAGERVRLVFVGNHCKGATFADGAEHVTEALTAWTEAIARALPEFYFGRLDVRFPSLADLRAGRGLRIIEINGVGSEATHIWDPSARLGPAYAAQFAHYRAAFRIGAANRAAGHRTAGLRALLRLWRLQRRLMASYPVHD